MDNQPAHTLTQAQSPAPVHAPSQADAPSWEASLRRTDTAPIARNARALSARKSAQASSEPLLRLNPSASLVFRSRRNVQFGLETFRTAVVTFPTHLCATRTVTFLNSTHDPLSREDTIAGLVKCGNQPGNARALVEDLIAFRVLVPAHPPVEMAIVGTGALATAVRELMPADCINVRYSAPSETESRFLARMPAGTPIILVDSLIEAPSYSTALRGKTDTIVQGYILDGRGYAGPTMVAGDGPCPLCLELYRLDLDPRWRMLVSQSLVRKGARDPLLVSVTAAHIVALCLRTAGFHCVQPGVGNYFHDPVSPAIPGELVVVDPYALSLTHKVMKPHPHCPECFERLNGTRPGLPAVPRQTFPA